MTLERGAEGYLLQNVVSLSADAAVLSPLEHWVTGMAISSREVFLSHFVPNCPICVWESADQEFSRSADSHTIEIW